MTPGARADLKGTPTALEVRWADLKVGAYLHVVAIAVLGVLLVAPGGAQSPDRESIVLSPTQHPAVPAALSQVWLAPGAGEKPSAALVDFAAGVKAFDAGQYSEALAIFSRPPLIETPLADWVTYYHALTLLRLERPAEARDAFASLAARQPAGYLSEAVLARQAEAAEALNDWTAALRFWDQVSQKTITQPEDVLMRLARAARQAGDPLRAAQAYARVYYEFPLSDLADTAASEIEQMNAWEPLETGSPRYRLELGRAERLFGARRYAQARPAFEALRRAATGDDAEVVGLRLAECDHFLRRYKSARDGVQPYLEQASRRAEASFFLATATRELGDHVNYVRLAREVIDKYPDSSWAEDALNNLASHYILVNDDPQADVVFRELLAKFPKGRFSERAAWKIGWWAYKSGRYDEASRTFDTAAAAFPRSDYRPPYLYWSARALDKLGDRRAAAEHYTLATADYLNSYYGRLAARALRARGQRPAGAIVVMAGEPATNGSSESGGEAPEPPLPPTSDRIRTLLVAGLYDQAILELRHAQRAWGGAPLLDATFAWIYHQQGDLRRGINAMKRAYPQYLASGGERLPVDVLKVLFPVNYWPLIEEHSTKWSLDPFLITALIAQESTFTPDIVSSAKAVGLMQVVAPTGRQIARSLKMRFTPSMLTRPDVNVRLGTAYFSQLSRRFGGEHYALASYNAGAHRVARWIAERPGLDQDEFIDDIPFPETQNYVKRVLGTAEDYRRLYSAAKPAPLSAASGATSAAPAAKAATRPGPPAPAVKKPAAKKPAAKKPAARKPAARRTPR